MASDRDKRQSLNNGLEPDRQGKIEILRRKRPSDPSFLNPDRPQFNSRGLLIAITAACVLFAAIATRHPAIGALIGLVVWVTYGFIQGWLMTVIERWIGDE